MDTWAVVELEGLIHYKLHFFCSHYAKPITERVTLDVRKESVVVQFNSGAILDFVVVQCDMILINDIPLLEADFLRLDAYLAGQNHLELSNGICRTEK